MNPLLLKYNTGNRERRMCDCGMLQTHTARWCNLCGTEFKLDPAQYTLAQVVQMHTLAMGGLGHNTPKEKLDRSISWWFAIWGRKLHINTEAEFRNLYNEAIQQV